jgi:XRE family aerobic/anaerobic benzoate catabolism transcriptional regulator
MSSNILPASSSLSPQRTADARGEARHDKAPGAESPRHPFLGQLGERVRSLRARAGFTRKALARATGVSERHLANLEYGVGNASILILLQVAQALQCPLAELLGDPTTQSAESLLIRELLAGRDDATLRRARITLGELLGTGGAHGQGGRARSQRVALIGLRGAGKSTLGALLADELGVPFVELSRQIEQFAGCSVSEIQALYGQTAYRRYERRAIEETIQTYPAAVIATPGGIASDPATFNLLLAHCTTVWLSASPEDHMNRVIAQGDTRPIAASREAMSDLKAILAGRTPFYAKAEIHVDTSAGPLEQTFTRLRQAVREVLDTASH